MNQPLYQKFIKRIIDVSVALLVLIVTSPLFLLACILLFFQNRGKVFFYQQRPGYQERPFRIIKFRTMTDRKGGDGQLLADVQRITPIGRILRSLSIDELPQLINVLKHDMSLIGPRPLLFKYIPLYTPEQRRRHSVLPGITGWAQINGRNGISWGEKFKHDLYYVDHLCFGLDVKIAFLTMLKIIKREGINQSEKRPMMPFDGTN